jgi:hypothetical protein
MSGNNPRNPTEDRPGAQYQDMVVSGNNPNKPADDGMTAAQHEEMIAAWTDRREPDGCWTRDRSKPGKG